MSSTERACFLTSVLRSVVIGGPITATVSVTDRCNARCGICPYWNIKAQTDDELRPNEYHALARKIRELGVCFVSLGGGEPLLRNDLEEIVAALKSSGLWVSVTTNGSLLTMPRMRRLRDSGLDQLLISLDFIRSGMHDRQRGIRGLFERNLTALRAMKHELSESPFRNAGIFTVLTSQNLDDIDGLVRLAAREGVTFQIQPYSIMKSGNAAFVPRASEVARVVLRLLLLKQTLGDVIVSSGEYIRRFTDFYQHGIGGCRAGQYFFHITADGLVKSCVEGPPVGSVDMKALDPISSPTARGFVRNCVGCWYACRGETELLFDSQGFLERLLFGSRRWLASLRRQTC